MLSTTTASRQTSERGDHGKNPQRTCFGLGLGFRKTRGEKDRERARVSEKGKERLEGRDFGEREC